MAHNFSGPNTSGRYQFEVEGHTAFASYHNIDGVIAITHTEVPSALREQGVGSRMVVAMLDDIRAQKLKARPVCSFARFVVAQHPEYRDLLS